MRIAFFSEAFEPQVNGVAVTISKVTEYLRNCGHEILLMVPETPRASNDSSLVEMKCVPLPLYPEMPIILPHWSFHKKPLARLEAFQPDLIHIWTPGVMAFFALKWARHHGCPVASSYETDLISYLDYYGFGRFKPQLWRYLRWLHNNSHRTYVPSMETKLFLEAGGIRNVEVFGRGVDVDRFCPSKRSAERREQFGLRPDGVLILYVGRLSREKNLPLLLKEAEKLTANNRQVHLAVTGTGPLWKELTRSFGNRRITFTDVQRGEDLATLFASADVFALPSSTETLSLVSMEAMASGVPVLAMNAGGVRDFLKHRVNSLLANDAAEFAGFLRLLAWDAELRKRLGANGRRCTEAQSWTDVLKQLEHDYVGLASHKGKLCA